MPLKAVNSLVLCLGHTTDRPFTLPGAVQADYCKLLHIDALNLCQPNRSLLLVHLGRAAPTLSCGSISSTECVQWGGRQYTASVTARVELAGSKWCLRAVALNVDKSWASGESHIGRQRRAKELKRVVSSEICIQVLYVSGRLHTCAFGRPNCRVVVYR